MDFNGIEIVADKNSDPAALAQSYRDETKRRSDEYLASDLYKRRMAEAEEAAEKRAATFAAAVEDAVERGVHVMTLSDKFAWEKTKAANQDGYGAAVVRYAETWARLMETRVLSGSTIAECAEETSGIADVDGITGAQYGMAATMLCQWWIHGDALRAWRSSKGPLY